MRALTGCTLPEPSAIGSTPANAVGVVCACASITAEAAEAPLDATVKPRGPRRRIPGAVSSVPPMVAMPASAANCPHCAAPHPRISRAITCAPNSGKHAVEARRRSMGYSPDRSVRNSPNHAMTRRSDARSLRGNCHTMSERRQGPGEKDGGSDGALLRTCQRSPMPLMVDWSRKTSDSLDMSQPRLKRERKSSGCTELSASCG
eukprot:6196285-Pleurochrysis_carterae.AAC.1